MPINDTSSKLLSHNGLNTTFISSADTFHVRDDYSLSASSSYYPRTNSDATTKAKSAGNYNSTNGYGLVNAGSAVSKAAGKNTFADVPNLGGNNWGADLVNAPESWANGYTGKGVVVAVIDTGVDSNHEDLKDNIWTNTKEIPGNGIDDDGNGYVDDVQGWNFADNNNNTLDDNGHGTHVSGTIAGENNGYGVTGIAYDAKIMPVKVLDESGSGSYSAIAKGIHYAVDNGANVINLSLGGYYSNNTLKSAIEYASSKGVIVVMAAGNDGESSPEYPARYANKSGIAVGAVDRNNNLADFSNRAGTNPIAYVTAPGVDIYSSVPGNQYATYSGTSMATPHVAGVVALMLSANPNLTDAQVRQIITETAGNNTQQTSTSDVGSFNISSVGHQAIAEIPVSSTSAKNFFNVQSLNESNTTTSSFQDVSTLTNTSTLVNTKSWSQFQYYDSTLSSNNNTGNDDDKNDDNQNSTDIDKMLNQFTQIQNRLEQYQKLFGRI
ncbi:S8 family serine peptidase [Nostocaceae cyanobacterium CENA369]|uniref:S8 family serine peptidase n=1 Tax=Dendronalium phyllosphericum CENA369 TaxID=1725256 RepID=A0A8J7I4I5_9NOST|nr:S8 family peptidase [Dendronalium phyllosphericum]MBH8572826.1 S8 family serine peptidase [Dendronalium phyllosphericum CENA369]